MRVRGNLLIHFTMLRDELSTIRQTARNVILLGRRNNFFIRRFLRRHEGVLGIVVGYVPISVANVGGILSHSLIRQPFFRGLYGYDGSNYPYLSRSMFLGSGRQVEVLS